MNDDIELSRRRTLAALGTIGAASAGAGLGTSAYFSDQETFQNNQLVAGELDMKVDWEEHYSDWSDDEDDPADSANPALDIQMDEPGTPGDYTAFPPGVEAFQGVADDDFVTGDPLLYVHNDDVSQFMDNTSIEAFPDEDNNAVQDDFNQDMACEILADVGNDDSGLDPTAGARSNNDDTMMDGAPAPLINLHDVKPGDFGELTLSFHLCNNPGYVWLNADNVSGAENGVTEPEADDPDEEENQPRPASDDSDSDVVELFDTIQTAWWYDDCDNLTQPGEEGDGGGSQADIVFVVDSSGSIAGDERPGIEDAITGTQNTTGVAEQIQNQGVDAQYAIVDYHQGAGIDLDLTSNVGDVGTAFGDGTASEASGSDSGSGGESLSNAILYAAGQKVSGEGVSFRPNSKRIYVGITDEPDQSTSQEKTDAVSEINGTNSAFLGISETENQISELLNGVNQSRHSTFQEGNISTPLQDLAGFAGGVTGGEEIFFQGTLREALNALESGNGIPLDGDSGNDFDEFADDPDAASRGCFQPTPATNCIGFSWWLPLDHGNEVQSDSVGFDLGFYTEQCRHNTGSGMNNENVSTNETDA